MNSIKVMIISMALLFALGACVPAPLVFGGASGGAVYSTTSDHIKDVFNMPKEQAFEIMIGLITADGGQITLSSIADGKIQAKTGKSLLFINIKAVNDSTTEVSIRAKKHIELIPDKDTATRYYRAFVKEAMKQ